MYRGAPGKEVRPRKEISSPKSTLKDAALTPKENSAPLTD